MSVPTPHTPPRRCAQANVVEVRRNNDTPDKEVQFSNLYARLLTQPVLSQKWSILYLLHQLADSNPDGEDPSSDQDRRPTSEGTGPGRYSDGQDSQVFRDAFATAGLPRLPLNESPPKLIHNIRAPTERIGYRNHTKTPETAETVVGKAQSVEPSEAALLRDLPFTLQGLSSTSLPFISLSTLDLPTTLPIPIISLLHTLAEPSLLYRRLSNFVESQDEGLMGQSLRSAIGSELRSYLGLITALEGEIRRSIISLDSNEQKYRIGKAGVTLKRCVVWTREATMGLRLMSLMVEKSGSACLAVLKHVSELTN